MKLLITGANGYLGSRFINQYKNKYKFVKFSLLNQKLEDTKFEIKGFNNKYEKQEALSWGY